MCNCRNNVRGRRHRHLFNKGPRDTDIREKKIEGIPEEAPLAPVQENPAPTPVPAENSN